MDNGFRPAGLFDMSSTTLTNQAEIFTDYGTNTRANGTATHNLTLYRAPSGALVFGAGTVQWAWGLDNPNGDSTDPAMQQATVNLFADMGVQPATLISGLTAATASTDTTAPTTTITSPTAGANVADGTKMTVTGTAADTGGVVAGVEVSTDGGTSWHPATGTTSWSYSWVTHGNPTATIKARAVDDSGNIQTASTSVAVNVTCSCSIWGNAATPGTSDSGSATAVEVGVKFKSDVSGSVTGIRFYKASTNTGTHVGNLWSASGTKLASATFTGESTSGWQQVTFTSPVTINANTTYVASYFAPAGHTAQDDSYLYPSPSPTPDRYDIVDSPPLHALRNTNGTLNGLFQNSSSSTLPDQQPERPELLGRRAVQPEDGGGDGAVRADGRDRDPGKASASVSWTTPSDGGSPITGYTVTPFIGTTAQTPTTVTGSPPATTVLVSGLTNGTTYTFKVSATNAVGTGPASSASNPVTPSATACTACTIWPSTATPASPSDSDPSSIEVGVKFTVGHQRVDHRDPVLQGQRRTPAPTSGNLWTSTGTKLASATFASETASGWQQVNFATPVPITAGTVYVASYLAPSGHYAADAGYFASAGVDTPPLHALKDGASGGDGVYAYGSSSTFPNNSFGAANYWVDVVFASGAATAPSAPTGVTATGGNASATVSWTAPSDGGSPITSYTVTPFIGTTAQTPTTVTGSPPATTANVTGLTNGTAYTFKVTATNAIGTGPASAASNSVTPAPPTAPGAPTGVTAAAGNASATVSWTAPSNGGSAITSYTVTPFIGTTAQTPTTVTGSPPATTATRDRPDQRHRVHVQGDRHQRRRHRTGVRRVERRHAVGNRLHGLHHLAVDGDADDPQRLRHLVGRARREVHRGRQRLDHGDPLLQGQRQHRHPRRQPVDVDRDQARHGHVRQRDRLRLAAGQLRHARWRSPPAPSTSPRTSPPSGHYAADGGYFAAAGVDNGPLHALKDGVSGGNGVYAYGSASRLPDQHLQQRQLLGRRRLRDRGRRRAPSAPTGVTATGGNASATVSWTAPSNGGSPITSYTVTPFIGTTRADADDGHRQPAGDHRHVTGLTNGTAYTFKVTRHQRRRHRAGLRRLELGHARPRRPCPGADRRHGDRGQRVRRR